MNKSTYIVVCQILAIILLVLVAYYDGVTQGRNELKAYQIGLELSGRCR
jgi:hypothetical protein